jgi:hypothetical protein
METIKNGVLVKHTGETIRHNICSVLSYSLITYDNNFPTGDILVQPFRMHLYQVGPHRMPSTTRGLVEIP